MGHRFRATRQRQAGVRLGHYQDSRNPRIPGPAIILARSGVFGEARRIERKPFGRFGRYVEARDIALRALGKTFFFQVVHVILGSALGMAPGDRTESISRC